MVHIHLNQKTTEMLIDESKLQLIVQLNFLNCKKQHTKGPVTLVRMNERVIRTSFQRIVVRITKFFLVSHC